MLNVEGKSRLKSFQSMNNNSINMSNEHNYCVPFVPEDAKTKTQTTKINTRVQNVTAVVKGLAPISSKKYPGITFFARPGRVKIVDSSNMASPKLVEGMIAHLPDGTHIITDDGSTFHINNENASAKQTKNTVGRKVLVHKNQDAPIIAKEVEILGNTADNICNIRGRIMKRMNLRKIESKDIMNLRNNNVKIISVKRKSKNQQLNCVESKTVQTYSVLKSTRKSHIAKMNALVNDGQKGSVSTQDKSPFSVITQEDVQTVSPASNKRYFPAQDSEISNVNCKTRKLMPQLIKSLQNPFKFNVNEIPPDQCDKNEEFVEKVSNVEVRNTCSSQPIQKYAPIAIAPKLNPSIAIGPSLDPPPLVPITKPQLFVMDKTVYQYNPPTLIGHIIPSSAATEEPQIKISKNNVIQQAPSKQKDPNCSCVKKPTNKQKLSVCGTTDMAERRSGVSKLSLNKQNIVKTINVPDSKNIASQRSAVCYLDAKKKNVLKKLNANNTTDIAGAGPAVNNLDVINKNNETNMNASHTRTIETSMNASKTKDTGDQASVDINLSVMEQTIQNNFNSCNTNDITERLSAGTDDFNGNEDIQTTVPTMTESPEEVKFKITRDVGLNVRYPDLSEQIQWYQKKLTLMKKTHGDLKLLRQEQELERQVSPYQRMNNIADLLNTKFSSLQIELLKAKMLNTKGPYTDEVKSFAREIYKASPKAYELVKQLFQLPHASLFKKEKRKSTN